MKGQVKFGMIAATLIVLLAPSLSQAQFRIGIGGGGRRGGSGISIGTGGYGGGSYYSGNRYNGGDRYYDNRYYGDNFGIGSNGVYFSTQPYNSWPQDQYYSVAPSTTYVTPSTSSYQSFYPSQQVTTSTASDGRSTLVVSVPPNATTWFNGSRSSLSGPVRQYVTLPLRSSGAQYEVTASWTDQNGQTVSRTRQVQAMPNQVVQVDFMHDQNSQATNNQQTPNMNNNPNINNQQQSSTAIQSNGLENMPADNAAIPPVPAPQ